jgi:hypothetical protein
MFGKLFGDKPNEVQLADRSWRNSVLLMKLLEAEGTSHPAIKLLTNESFTLIRSDGIRKRVTGLNLLRFLFKAKHVEYNKPLLDEVLDIFFSTQSLAARLASLDMLGVMRTTPNPMEQLSAKETEALVSFRSKLMSSLNASQRQYSTEGVASDVAREVARCSPFDAIKSVVARVGQSAGPRHKCDG